MINKPKQQRPVVGGFTDTWGDALNQNMDVIDNFASEVVDELGTHSQELARLEQDKINMSDLDTLVADRVDNYIETDAKPQMDDYIETVEKPKLDKYTTQKKSEINNHVETVSKVAINDFTEVQKIELDAHEKVKEGQLDAYELVKEGELDFHTVAKQTQLDAYEVSKEAELETFTIAKKAEMNTYKDSMNAEVNTFSEGKKVEITQHTDTKKGELDTYEKSKEAQLDTFTTTKEGQIDTYVTNKKGEIDTKTEAEKAELDTYNELKKGQLDTHETAKEVQLDAYADGREVDMTAHADAEIARINATGIDGKVDKSSYESDKVILESEINSKLSSDIFNAVEVIAGRGTTGGGKLSSNPVFNIVSEDEGIIINEDNIKLNVVDDLITGGVKKPLSAEQGKVLKQLIDAIGGGGVTRLLRASEALSEYDYMGTLPANGTSIAVGKQLFDPTLYLDGIRIESNTYSVDLNTGLLILTTPYSPNYPVIWVVEDRMPFHITFCFPTLALLLASADMKGRIVVGDVIKLLGESDADDGGSYLVKCEDIAKLNAVDIGNGRFLNEIPNTKISDKANKTTRILAGAGLVGGGDLSGDRTLSLKPATSSELGGVKSSDFIKVDNNGKMNLERITNATDANLLKKEGIYSLAGNACLNLPTNLAKFYQLEVKTTGSNPKYCDQVATDNSLNEMFIRTCVNDIWKPWEQLARVSNVDATYVKKTGDVSTGQQNMDCGSSTARSFLYSTFASQLGVFKGLYNNMDNGMYMDVQGTGASLYLKYAGKNKPLILCSTTTGSVSYSGGNFDSDTTIKGSPIWTDATNTISKTLNGWCKFANGLIVQWGEDVGTKVINFPISFAATPQLITSGIVADTSPIYQTLSGGANCNSRSFTLVSYGYNILGDTGSGLLNASYKSTSSRADFAGKTKWIAIGY